MPFSRTILPYYFLLGYPMHRIARRFDALRIAGRTALIPYITAGHPHPDHTVPMLHALVAAGADILELGVPFSDPMADGPVIQRACETALMHGMSLQGVLALVRTFRETDPNTPVVLMGYANPIECMGYENFVAAAKAAGVDGVLTVDLPPEEAEPLSTLLAAAEIANIFLLAPTTSPERVRTIANGAQGYLYYVSLKGVTGSAALDLADVEAKLRVIRAQTSLPMGVGFGIKDAPTAAAMAKMADAVVVGSVLVQQMGTLSGAPNEYAAVAGLLSEMRQAMDAS